MKAGKQSWYAAARVAPYKDNKMTVQRTEKDSSHEGCCLFSGLNDDSAMLPEIADTPAGERLTGIKTCPLKGCWRTHRLWPKAEYC